MKTWFSYDPYGDGFVVGAFMAGTRVGRFCLHKIAKG